MIFLFKVTHWDSIKNPYFSMVPGTFLQKKLTKKSLRIIPWDFPTLPLSGKVYFPSSPLLHTACFKKELKGRRREKRRGRM